MQTEETWKAAADFQNYEVSTHGRVRRLTTNTCAKAGNILKPSKHYRGYWQHGLTRNGKLYTVRLNRLVCGTFHGEAPSAHHHAAHNDSNVDNNFASNLRWATQLENEDDKTRAGNRAVGSAVKHSKLNEDQAKQIKYSNIPAKDAAERFGISIGLVYMIRNGRAWKHV